MRAPGDILLVSCYELGRQPLGIAVPAAFLERAGFRPATLDISVESLDEARIASAKLVLIAVPMHTALRLGMRVADRVRAIRPDAHICFHGIYATLNADRLLGRGGARRGRADSLTGGECEPVLVALAESLERTLSGGGDHVSPIDIPGLETAAKSASPVLEKLPFPAPSRARLPVLGRYAKLDRDGVTGLAGAVEASRGCLHLCRHCPIPSVYDGRFFVVPEDVVLADVAALVDAGATHITFADPDFFNGSAHARRVVEALHARFPSLTYDVTVKVEHLLKHRALLPVLAATGCVFIVSAVESLSERVLAILDKGHSKADVVEALALTRAAGLALRPSLLPFTPWTTLEDYREIVDFVVTNDLVDHVDPIQLSIRLLVPPGSLLEKHAEMTPHLGKLVPDLCTWTWSHPDPRMDALHQAASAIVADAAMTHEDAATTFERLRVAATGVHRERSRDEKARRPKAPRLTEPWFC